MELTKREIEILNLYTGEGVEACYLADPLGDLTVEVMEQRVAEFLIKEE